MALYSTALRTSFFQGAGTPLLEIKAGPTDAPRVTEIFFSDIINSSGSTLVFGLGIAAAQGVPLNSALFLPEDPSLQNCNTFLIADWTTLPTVPAKFFRRFDFNTAITNRPYWRLLLPADGIGLAVNQSLLLWTIAGGGGSAGRTFISEVHARIEL